jgi:hypothetical protein
MLRRSILVSKDEPGVMCGKKGLKGWIDTNARPILFHTYLLPRTPVGKNGGEGVDRICTFTVMPRWCVDWTELRDNRTKGMTMYLLKNGFILQ